MNRSSSDPARSSLDLPRLAAVAFVLLLVAGMTTAACQETVVNMDRSEEGDGGT